VKIGQKLPNLVNQERFRISKNIAPKGNNPR
jgi:hypothetical protein